MKFIVPANQHFCKRLWFNILPLPHLGRLLFKPSKLECVFEVDNSWFVMQRSNSSQWNKIVGFSRGSQDNFSIRLCFNQPAKDEIGFSIYVYEEDPANYYSLNESIVSSNPKARYVYHTSFYLPKKSHLKTFRFKLCFDSVDQPSMFDWSLCLLNENGYSIRSKRGSVYFKYPYGLINDLFKLPTLGYLLYPYYGGSQPAPVKWKVSFKKLKIS